MFCKHISKGKHLECNTEVCTKKLSKLDQNLCLIQQKILNIAKKENDLALEKLLSSNGEIFDYEIELHIAFYIDCDELISWNEDMLVQLKNDTKQYQSIQTQDTDDSDLEQYSWFLRKLYYACSMDWKKIINISTVGFDIEVKYQYFIEIDE